MARDRINIAGAPLSKNVLAAKRYRLEARWRECLVVTGILGAGFGLALWSYMTELSDDARALSGAITVVLALILVCALHVLQLNHLTRTGLLPATASHLELVALARDLPAVSRYIEAVQAQGRSLNRAEAGAIAKYNARVPRAKASHARERGSIDRDI